MEALLKKKALGAGSLSDHMCLLICFQMWQVRSLLNVLKNALIQKVEQILCKFMFMFQSMDYTRIDF